MSAETSPLKPRYSKDCQFRAREDHFFLFCTRIGGSGEIRIFDSAFFLQNTVRSGEEGWNSIGILLTHEIKVIGSCDNTDQAFALDNGKMSDIVLEQEFFDLSNGDILRG